MIEQRDFRGPDLALVRTFSKVWLPPKHDIAWSPDSRRFILGQNQQRSLYDTETGEKITEWPIDCYPINNAESKYCIYGGTTIYRSGSKSPYFQLPNGTALGWSHSGALGLFRKGDRERDLLLVDLDKRQLLQLDIEAPVLECNPTDIGCKTYGQKFLFLDQFKRYYGFSPNGEYWAIKLESNGMLVVGSVATRKALFRYARGGDFYWSPGGNAVELLSFHDWSRYDFSTHQLLKQGQLIHWIQRNLQIVEYNGNFFLLVDGERKIPIAKESLRNVNELLAAMPEARLFIFGGWDEVILSRFSDGKPLYVRFINGVPILVSDEGLYNADATLRHMLTFAPRDHLQDGPLLNGDELSGYCYEPKLLERFIKGESLSCSVPTGALER